MASPIGYQLSHKDPNFVDTWLRCFAAIARIKKLKDDKEKRGENEIMDLFGYCWMRGDDESLHQGVSHKPGRPDFWKNVRS